MNEKELNKFITWLEDMIVKAKVCWNPNDNHRDFYRGKQHAYENVLNILQTGQYKIDDDN